MGAENSVGNSIISHKFLQSLTITTPLKSINQPETQVHELVCLSAEHHQIMLEKIRIKKNYDCPFLIRIIDSHTLESKNLCSTIIKTYIAVEKPQSLAEEIQQRISLGLGFEEGQLWTLIYSCCVGALYLKKNNVGLARLNSSKIFIDLKGGIKINDPDFLEGSGHFQRIDEGQFLESLREVCKELTNHQAMIYSSRILELICLMGKPGCSLVDIEMYIKDKYLEGKKQNLTLDNFSAVKNNKKEVRPKQKLKMMSGRKYSTSTHQLQTRNCTSQFMNIESLGSNHKKSEKENRKCNQIQSRRNRLELFTFKNLTKELQSQNRQDHPLESHLFPKKALFCQKRRLQTAHETSFQCQISPSSTYHKQILTRESHSVLAETDPSLDGSQLLNMISSYQVDQETFVREVCQEQSQYFLQLMNQAKCKVGGTELGVGEEGR